MKTKATKKKVAPKVGDLRVWWIPQVPMPSFRVDVRTLREARLLLNTLADYDKFQLGNNIKPDYCNAGGLVIWSTDSDGGTPNWIDWHDSEGRGIDEIPDDELDTAVWEEEG